MADATNSPGDSGTPADVDKEAQALERGFGLAPDTARATAADKLTPGTGKPASADVDSKRAAEARNTSESEGNI